MTQPTPTTTDTTDLAPPLDAPTITARASDLVVQVEGAVQGLKKRLQDVPAERDATVDSVQVFMTQQDPFYARQLAAREVTMAEQALATLDAVLTDARTAVVAHAGALRGLSATAADRRARLEVLGEFQDDPFEQALSLAQLTHSRLQRLVAQVEPWRPTAADTVARLAVAMVIALRRQRVAALPGALAALKARVDALHDPDAHDRDAAAVLARMAARVGHPLPVATIRWPTTGGPFDPPTLGDPEET